MTKIRMLGDDEVAPDIAPLFAAIKATHPTGDVPPIYRTMTHHPEFFQAIKTAAEVLHFRDGALSRAQHEMVASYVAALNHCRY